MTIDILKLVASKGLYNSFDTTTQDLAKKINLSQQSTSRILIEMQKSGLIEKQSSKKGTSITLTKKGINKLEKEYEELKNIFTDQQSLVCKIKEGIGEGKFYVKIYASRLKDILEYKPFFGTLNLSAKTQDIKSFLRNKKFFTIQKFNDNDRTYGEVDVYPANIDEYDCAILVPRRTSHPDDIIEVVSKHNLKKVLDVNIGDKIELIIK